MDVNLCQSSEDRVSISVALVDMYVLIIIIIFFLILFFFFNAKKHF